MTEFEKDGLSFHKEDGEKVWTVSRKDRTMGEVLYSFDGEHVINLWTDFPGSLTKEQINAFTRENPYWATYFAARLAGWEKEHGETLDRWQVEPDWWN